MKDDHTVEYRSIDYYSMCEKSKARIKAMQEAGIPTRHDPQDSPEKVIGKGSEMTYMMFEF